MELEQNPPPAEESRSGGYRWYHKAAALVYIFFCFELGIFLLVFPWVDMWQQNFFSGIAPSWYQVWNSPYLRGAISGLGVLDVGISFVELFRLRRFAKE
jgi:hypothetical protein